MAQVEMDSKEFKDEHRRLIRVLLSGSPAQRKKEAEFQRQELQKKSIKDKLRK